MRYLKTFEGILDNLFHNMEVGDYVMLKVAHYVQPSIRDYANSHIGQIVEVLDDSVIVRFDDYIPIELAKEFINGTDKELHSSYVYKTSKDKEYLELLLASENYNL